MSRVTVACAVTQFTVNAWDARQMALVSYRSSETQSNGCSLLVV